MDLISFVFKTRIKLYFTGRGAASRILGLVVFSLLAIFYGWVFAYFIDYPSGKDINLDRVHMIKGLMTFVIFSTLVRAYLPGYKPKTEIISVIYPVNALKRFKVDLMVDFIYPYFFVVVLFLSVIKSFSFEFNVFLYLQALILLLSSHMIRRIVQTVLERKLKINFQGILSLIFSIVIALYLIVQDSLILIRGNGLSIVMLFISLLTLIGADYVLETAVVESKKVNRSRIYQKGFFNNILTAFIFNNKTARKTILVALLLKLAIIVIDLVMQLNNGSHIFNNMYIVWLYVSPLILYSYIYSNTWGFYRTLWLTVDKSTADFASVLKTHLKLMSLPFLVDFLLAAVYLVITGKDVWFGFLFYLVSLGVIIPISIFSSTTAARYVEKPLSFRANSSVAFRFLSVGVISSLILIKYFPFLAWIVLLYFACAVYIVVYCFRNYHNYKYRIFESLFKAGSTK